MKVAFFTPHVLWNTHYLTELELIQIHLDQGDEIVQLICNAELPTCDTNPNHNIQTCLSCIGCRNFGKNTVKNDLLQQSFLKLKPEDKEEIEKLKKEFKNIKDLQSLWIDNFDLGFAVASSLITDLRDPDPDLQEHNIRLVGYLVSSLGIYRSMINFLKEKKVERVYTFNGRFAHVKPVLRACQLLSIDCYVHERGNSKDHFALYVNTTPHDINYTENQINSLWSATQSEDRKTIGMEFFENRAKGVMKNWHSFTNEQTAGLLPEDWDTSKQNIVIFNSSEDEFASIGDEWKNTLYKSQLEGLKRMIADLNSYPHIHLYLRVHPNLKKVVNEEKKRLYELQGDNFTLIPAESSVSTYELLKVASKVITFGSTIGIEAVYWGVPSILAGKSYYHNLGGTYNPSSHAQLIELLLSELKPKPVEPALMYGFYMNTYGIPFQEYQAETIFKGTFKGLEVYKSTHVKNPFLNWLLYKPIIRNFRPGFNKLHQQYILKTKYQ